MPFPAVNLNHSGLSSLDTATNSTLTFLTGAPTTLSPAEAEAAALEAHYLAVAAALRLWVTPVVLFGGTLGNLLTIAVVLSRHFRYNPSCVPLITLAVVDIGVLYFNLLDFWLGALLGGSLQYTRNLSSAGCKLSTFTTVFLTQYSSWILVLINVDRVISVYRPLQARTWCSRKRHGAALFCVLLALAAVDVHLFWTTEYRADELPDTCVYNFEPLGAHGEAWWTTIDAALFSYIPFLLILVCNVSIVWSLVKTTRRRRACPGNGSSSGVHIHVRNALPTDSTTSITTMLLTISLVFIITTSPLTVCYQLYDVVVPALKADRVAFAFWWELVINTVLVLVCFSNNALNFLLYCISGSKFRCALNDLCRTRRRGLRSRPGTGDRRYLYRASASPGCTDHRATFTRGATYRTSLADGGAVVNGSAGAHHMTRLKGPASRQPPATPTPPPCGDGHAKELTLFESVEE